jgi:hypothetical protein
VSGNATNAYDIESHIAEIYDQVETCTDDLNLSCRLIGGCELAAITAAATVEYALSHGFSMVGWQCLEDNLGSIGTAEKVGFERERDYRMYDVVLKQEANVEG